MPLLYACNKVMFSHVAGQMMNFQSTISDIETEVADPERVHGGRLNPPPRPPFLNIL